MLRSLRYALFWLAVTAAVLLGSRPPAVLTDGPLADLTGGGGSGLDAPRGAGPWHATYGDLIVCAKAPGADIELTGVRVHTTVAPRSLTVYLRRVTSVQVGASGDPKDGDTPIGTLRGVPPDFRESAYPGLGRQRGTWTTHIAGTRISQPCSDARKSGHGFTELLLTLEVGRRGAQVDDLWVDYLTHGRRASARANWTFVACGSAVTEPGMCGNPDE